MENIAEILDNIDGKVQLLADKVADLQQRNYILMRENEHLRNRMAEMEQMELSLMLSSNQKSSDKKQKKEEDRSVTQPLKEAKQYIQQIDGYIDELKKEHR